MADSTSGRPARAGAVSGPRDGVIDARDPDGLERQIEATRAELARTIDSITDRVAPKNVARRGIQKAKDEAALVVQGVKGSLSGVTRGESRRVDPHSGIADDIVTTDYRRMPVPPGVLIGAGVAAVAVTALIVWRRRRH